MIIRISRLGLAAYAKINGAVLIKHENSEFVFEAKQSVTELEIAYANSCCSAHDATVMHLRRFMRD